MNTYRRVLSQAGALPWARDAVDARFTADPEAAGLAPVAFTAKLDGVVASAIVQILVTPAEGGS